MLVDAVEYRRGREAQRHVLQPGLSERVRRAREIEQVVNHLEGHAKVVTKLLGGDGDLRLAAVRG